MYRETGNDHKAANAIAAIMLVIFLIPVAFLFVEALDLDVEDQSGHVSVDCAQFTEQAQVFRCINR